MTSPRLALRSLAVLALAAPAACVVENPGFKVDTAGTRTGTDTASSVGTTGTGTTGTDAVDTGMITGAPTSTTQPTGSTGLPVDSTTTDATTDATTVADSGPDSSTGMVPCIATELQLMAEADGFYIAGGTLGGTTCDYPAKINGSLFPCKDLNFGVTHGLRIARGANNFDAMYVVRFAKKEFLQLKEMGVTSATAELALNVYAAPPAVDMRVGMIKDQWTEGARDGTLAEEGDSSFASPQLGIQAPPWSHPDGPRGASTKVTTLSVPDNYPDASYIETPSFPIDAWLADPDLAEGLVVSFFKDDALGTEGPSINARENPAPAVQPFLRVHYCLP